MERTKRRPQEPTGQNAEDAPLLPFAPEAFRKKLAAWYRKHARRLPWRGIRNPYATWISEIMLQQTRVAAVIERYTTFLEAFPTIAALAAAEEDDVLSLWSGLGYYRRARLLHRGAQVVAREMHGKLPNTVAELRKLPGVGDYTAAAIASIAFRQPVAVLDGNVERVLLRILGRTEEDSSKANAELKRTAQALVPPATPASSRANPAGDHNQAMMELGAMICLPRSPLCLECPVLDFCQTRGEHPTLVRDRPRSLNVAHLLALRKRGTATEVLLERRSPDASLMPGMLELPPLPLDAVQGRQPILRLRHSITNTNYYVEIFSSAANGAEPLTSDPADPAPDLLQPAPEMENEDESVFRSEGGKTADEGSLMEAMTASPDVLVWQPTNKLLSVPLTGLARKALQRAGVLSLPLPILR